ncbi:MAG: transporter substrate-binding domain-containing protein [Alphaproteobacteria bacterium]|nr:transporter substrate-binding domain-containing protein [Alphaproteobacteria bacterium]
MPRLRITFIFLFISFAFTAKAEPLSFKTLDISPWGFKSQTGESKGILNDIAYEIGKLSGLTINHSLEPLARVVEAVKASIPGCTIVARSPYSEAFSYPIADIKIAAQLIVLAKKETPLATYEDLKGLNIGVVRGSHFNHQFDKDTSFKKRFTKDDYQAVLMLQRGRVDAIAGPLMAFRFNMRRVNFDQNTLAPPLVLTERDFWVHCSKSGVSLEQVLKLQEATKKLVKSGRVSEIWHSYIN